MEISSTIHERRVRQLRTNVRMKMAAGIVYTVKPVCCLKLSPAGHQTAVKIHTFICGAHCLVNYR